MGEWIKAEEPPDSRRDVLVAFSNRIRLVAWYNEGEWLYPAADSIPCSWGNPKIWHELPKLPEPPK